MFLARTVVLLMLRKHNNWAHYVLWQLPPWSSTGRTSHRSWCEHTPQGWRDFRPRHTAPRRPHTCPTSWRRECPSLCLCGLAVRTKEEWSGQLTNYQKHINFNLGIWVTQSCQILLGNYDTFRYQ